MFDRSLSAEPHGAHMVQVIDLKVCGDSELERSKPVGKVAWLSEVFK